MPEVNGKEWSELRYHILAELERINATHVVHSKKLDLIHTDIVILKVKAGFYGAIAGCVVTVLGHLVVFFLSK